jgi:serine/threonine-protein kinase
MMLGTPAYMAPELAHSRAGSDAVNPSADIFSFGVLAHQLLTGRLPHAMPPILARLSGHIVTAPRLGELCPDIPAGLCRALDDCLLDAPRARPTAAHLAEVFRRSLFVRVDGVEHPVSTRIET